MACPYTSFLFMGKLLSNNSRRTGSRRAARFPWLGCAFTSPEMRRDHSWPSNAGQGQTVAKLLSPFVTFQPPEAGFQPSNMRKAGKELE
jgi:hypothetical protein